MADITSTAIRYGHIFVDGDDQYLFVSHLARGAQCHVQLVVKVSPQAGELLIRKVAIHRLESPMLISEDNESRAGLYLQEQARLTQVQPNIVHLYSVNNVESFPIPIGHPRHVHRVSYMRYYNGGSLEQLFESYKRRGQLIPRPLIRRLAWQFMYSLDRPVLHRDLEMRNIFVHFEENSNVPDFYIGDFGSAMIGPFAPGTEVLLRDIQSLHETIVRLLNCPSTSRSLGAPSGDGPECLLRDWLSKLHRLAFPEGPDSRGTVLPDLAPLLNDIAAMTAPVPRIRRTPAALSLPLYHDTREAAEDVSQIHGPWYVARVRNDPISGLPGIVEVDETKTYHRPNRHNSESDTDDDL
ncbi:Serine/threonine-protein kinase Nek6 [Cytospora mali]|uniref:Serine/threonine-protein kinase Nek6 n=1 Tax=Cytospora mali TaxID=578113 RepID=A0A194WAD9_CYTMA|nr:Serine/threonine-protein kinase Nek6 [Valsa mali]